MKCPSCNKGQLVKTTLINGKAKLMGIEFPVRNMKVIQCARCEERVYEAKELIRWELILHQLLKEGTVKIPTNINTENKND